MCCFEKRDLYITGVQVEDIPESLILNLRTTFDKKDYNDFFTIDRPTGRTFETLFTIPFSDVEDVTYQRNPSGAFCTISFSLVSGDRRLECVKVKTGCFNVFTVKKMIKLCKKHQD